MLDFTDYLDRLASADPTPGGGSAAALSGAMAAALVAMVARITERSPKLAAVHADAKTLAAEADALRARFLTARLRDEAAYGAVIAAQALPKSNDAEKAARTDALQSALTGAALAPLETAELAVDAFAQTERAALLRNFHLMSDVDCALRLARAALDAAAANVAVNHRFITHEATIGEQRSQLDRLARDAKTTEARVLHLLAAA